QHLVRRPGANGCAGASQRVESLAQKLLMAKARDEPCFFASGKAGYGGFVNGVAESIYALSGRRRYVNGCIRDSPKLSSRRQVAFIADHNSFFQILRSR